MTVKETLDFRVELKMGSCLKTKKERDDLVTDLMNQLGLTKSANTIVGNAKVRGLSGGERKRLSIACEMISSPPVIFLDEVSVGNARMASSLHLYQTNVYLIAHKWP
jgi:ABC-type multidrug transport system ATPase subunit